jgi:preprotein translocase subunit SecF
MEFFRHNTNFKFMGIRKFTTAFSVLISVASIFFLVTKGLNFGLDFTGGTQLELRFSEAVAPDAIKTHLSVHDYPEAKVAQYGSTKDILIRLPNVAQMSEEKLGAAIVKNLQQEWPSAELRRVEFVGSEVGQQLAEQGGLAVLVALLATMIYIAIRFEYRFAISAAVALLHDPIVILGVFAFFQIEFDLATLASILAVMGYSLNDTIVVYDRIRENFRKLRQGSVSEIIDISINQTLSRTLMTSFLTFIVVIALFLCGGESLHGFSTAFLIGIVIGTYSSIYIAGALALGLGLSRHDLLPKAKERLMDDSP